MNTLGQAAAKAALRASAQVRERSAAIAGERDRLSDVLRQQGWVVPRSGGNFVWLPLDSVAEDFVQFCAERGVEVLACPGGGVRVTIAEPAANDTFADVASEFRRANEDRSSAEVLSEPIACE
ncbi:MAG: aminotransferase class I/II-fold pyridoxal phosphate-dependent enzyme [Kutzneria sp.]|nr:aminotransferase class I/II-fold pyridoxal phosphate-dependent enzyme [Kutzneria sp.]